MSESVNPGVDVRAAMSHFAAGVTVVTTLDGEGRPHGTTASAVTSLSIDPPLLLVCLAHTSNTLDVLRASDRFAVNILSAEQHDLAHAFARSGPGEEWSGLEWERGAATGSPLIESSLAAIECELEAVHPGGDHAIAVGKILQTHLRWGTDRPALVHFRRELGAFGSEFQNGAQR